MIHTHRPHNHWSVIERKEKWEKKGEKTFDTHPKGHFQHKSSDTKSKGRDRTFHRYTRNRRSAGLGNDFKHEDRNISVSVTTHIPAKNVKDTLACFFWSLLSPVKKHFRLPYYYYSTLCLQMKATQDKNREHQEWETTTNKFVTAVTSLTAKQPKKAAQCSRRMNSESIFGKFSLANMQCCMKYHLFTFPQLHQN